MCEDIRDHVGVCILEHDEVVTSYKTFPVTHDHACSFFINSRRRRSHPWCNLDLLSCLEKKFVKNRRGHINSQASLEFVREVSRIDFVTRYRKFQLEFIRCLEID